MNKAAIFKHSRLRTLLLGILGGIAYAFLCLGIMSDLFMNVSIAYIFIVPIIIGAMPVVFSTKEQLQSYAIYIIVPLVSVVLFFGLCILFQIEGLICIVIIIAPFIILGAFGAFIATLARLKSEGPKTPLYSSLLLPFLFLLVEVNIIPATQIETAKTHVIIHAKQETVWQNIKNIKQIQPSEIEPHFIHSIMNIPKPLNGELNKEGIGGIRSITWEKGIRFQEKIKDWQEGKSFAYNIDVDPNSISPKTLDEHVMIGGKYFDVLEGSYQIEPINTNNCKVTLSCTYRVTTTLNFYANWWAGFVLNDFNEMILEVVQHRSEQ